jgi:hypothetical protein
MAPDTGPDRDDPPADRPSHREDALAWLRTPLTMRQLSALGMFVVGGGIPVAVVAGGWAWLGLGVMVIVILAMAMAFEGGWPRKPHRPSRRALRRTRRRRRALRPGESAETRRDGGSGGKRSGVTATSRPLPPSRGREPSGAVRRREREPVRGSAPREKKETRDRG